MVRAVICFAVLLLTLVACSSAASTDGGATFACGELRDFARDVNAGVVLKSEYRARAKKVYDKGVLAHDAGVVRASTELLASFTDGTDARQGAAVTAMDAACKRLDL